VIAKAQNASVPSAENNVTPTQVLVAFAGLFLLNLLLRVFYIRYDFVNGDEGVRALTAVRMLEGARLYADVVTDKPPGASLFYAAVFAAFGRSMKAVHLAAIVWNFATSVVIYVTASRFYTRRTGLWAALLFVYFSTNYFTQDTMAANTELLMALPYAAAFCCFIASHNGFNQDNNKTFSRFAGVMLIASGLLTGLATMFKQIGVLNLGFFALYEVLAAWETPWSVAGGRWPVAGEMRSDFERRATLTKVIRRAVTRLSLVGFGFGLIVAAFVLWLYSTRTLRDFWRNGVVLNMFYIDSEPAGLWMKFMIGRGLGYIFFNAVLWTLAVCAAWCAFKKRDSGDTGDSEEATRTVRLDRTVTLWAGVSLAGVLMSGRFYGHYFIPALPALSLLAARGVRLFAGALGDPAHKRVARAGLAVLALLFLIGFFRSHHRTMVLAYETVTGTRTRLSDNWGMTKREQEAEVVSRFVRDRVPAGEPLYIWGYAHDVYWRTRCRPGSRYLTPYFVDGRFADAEAAVSSSGADFRREAAATLLDDLRRTQPQLILDVEGSFKSLPYAELVDFVESRYREEGPIGPGSSNRFRVFQLKTVQAETEVGR
jgi:hypothetical protein